MSNPPSGTALGFVLDKLSDTVNAGDDLLAFLEASEKDPRMEGVAREMVSSLAAQATTFKRRVGKYWHKLVELGFTVEELAKIAEAPEEEIRKIMQSYDMREESRQNFRTQNGRGGKKPRAQTPRRRGPKK